MAVLITFGALNRNSELTAMKATGISLYRIVAPILVVATLLSALLFIFDERYLPAANRRQEALLSEIKGKPAQTFLRPDRKWMSGQTSGNNQPTRIFYYQFFDPDRNDFANLTVFEFQPGTFNLTRRIFAQSARWDDKLNQWVFEDGWQRTFQGESTATYEPFAVSTFPEIHEQPSYFKKEDRQSEQMSYTELATYINDLKQSGFDTIASPRPAESQTSLPAHDAGSRHPRHSLRALRRQARRHRRHRHGHRRSHLLLGHRRHLRKPR